MLAGDDDTPRSRSITALDELLKPEGFNPLAKPRYGVRYVLAGTEPQLLNEVAKSASEAIAELERWGCLSPSADLEAAVSFAATLGGSKALMLVLTDEPPAHALESDRIQWWSFGIPQSNLAFVNATRNPSESGERCLFEITNLSGRARATELVVELHDAAAARSVTPLHRSAADILPMETHRIFLNLQAKNAGITGADWRGMRCQSITQLCYCRRYGNRCMWISEFKTSSSDHSLKTHWKPPKEAYPQRHSPI